MITLISFILILVGAANWLCIGLMQYDFIAGFFGTQSSLMSRLIYIVIGFGAVWFLLMAFKQKGQIKINSNGFAKMNDPLGKSRRSEQRQYQISNSQTTNPRSNVEAGQEFNQTDNSNEQYRQNNNVELGQEIHQNNNNIHRNPFD